MCYNVGALERKCDGAQTPETGEMPRGNCVSRFFVGG
jgi:hypothetical protein